MKRAVRGGRHSAEPARPQHEQQHDPGDEPADMGPERDTAAALAQQPARQLCGKPQAEHDPGRHRDDPQENDHQHQHMHIGIGVDQQIGAEHAGNCSARAEHRDGRARVGERLAQRRGDAARQIEQQVADVPEHILDIVPEDPQEQHVAADMQPARVEEHAGEDRRPGRQPTGASARPAAAPRRTAPPGSSRSYRRPRRRPGRAATGRR